MQDKDLAERIWVWLGFENQDPLPPPKNALEVEVQAKFNRDWDRERLLAVIAMQVSPGISGTPAEKDLLDAIALAKTGVATHLPKIKGLLEQVFKALVPPKTSK